MLHSKRLKLLKDIIDKNDFSDLPIIFFDDQSGEITPYENIKDFCRYWLQKDIKLYSKFRESFASFRKEQLKIFESIAILEKEENRTKINQLTFVQFKIRTMDFVEASSVVLNLSDMLISFCSSIMDEFILEEELKEDKSKNDKK